ncbi:MAG: InlB B-repeat-containing protein [Paludibacteraceae bacterium]|nr:InlB B-repeat-containing protein [Paludibacteraceae bacterium]
MRDASSASLQYSGANTDCTLDLNGHTLTCTSAQLILNMNKAGCTFTITDKTESKSGQMRINATKTDQAYGVYINQGHLKLEAGTIYASLVATTCAGVRAVNANSSFTMDGGTIHVVTTNAKNGIGVTASNGTTTINDGTIQVEAAADGYGINRTGGTVTVDGGKFSISATGSAYATNQASANASVVIRGGYYTTNNQLNPTAPYHVFGLDNQSPYLYEVAEGYTLTWTTDGDPLTGTYTSGVTKPGTTITAPATPTKTGYTFKDWGVTTPAAVMPSNDLTYTATWTANQYTITFDSNGGSEVASITQAYGTTVTPPADPTRLGYNFMGWTPAVPSTMPIDGAACTAQWEIIPYAISYTLDGGTESPANPTTYNVETATFTLNNPTKEGYTFLGWTGSNGSTPQTAVSISAGSTGDKNYTANWAVNVASVTINSTTAYYTSFADAWTAANSATAASTLTLLQDISGLSSTRTYSASHDLTLDLNGHTLSGSGTSLFQIGCAENTFTVTDGSANHDGKLSFTTAESSTLSFHCVIVNNGTFVLEAGTIEATSSTVSIGALKVAGGTFTMKENGAVHAKYTGNVAGKNSRIVNATGGTTNINGGTIHLESTSDAIGVVYSNGTVTITGGNFKIEADHTAAVTNQNGAKNNLNIRGGYYSANTTTYFEPHVKTSYHIFSNSDATYIYRVAEAYTVTFNNDDVTLQSGLWEKGTTPIYSGETPVKAATAQYTYTFNGWNLPIAPVTEDVIYTAQFSSTVNTYTVTWKDADGTTLETDENVPYGNTPAYNGATPAKATDAGYAYTFSGWSPSVSAVTGDATYTATYTTTPVVASVTVNGATTYYTTIDATFTAANASATYEPTITLLQDAVTTTTSMLSYTGAKNCTLNLNGHTLSSTTAQALLYINKADVTFTITDLTESKSGTLHLESAFTDKTWCVYVANGNLQMDAGTVLLRSKATTYNEGVRIDPTASTFTMNGGKVQVVTSDGKPACGIVSRGIAVINGGEIQVETSGIGYGIEARVSDDGKNIGNVTVKGGKFLVTGTTAACAYRSDTKATLKLQGGYYSTDTDLAANCATNYHLFPNSDATYRYKVAEGYTVTFMNGEEVLQSELLEVGTTPVYSGAMPTKPEDAQYTYAFSGWDATIVPVVADATYSATFAPTEKPQESIVVNEGETTTIDVNTETTTTIVHVSGLLNVEDNVTLTTLDLILEATPSSSGEIIGDVAVNQNAYFDLSQPGGFKAKTWYAIAVPWQVEVPAYALGDVSLSNDGENYTPQTLGSTFDLIYYDGARRATGASKAWNYVEDDPASKQVMLPGRAYMIYLTTNASFIRFRKSTSAALHTNELDVLKYPSSVDANYADWNGIANPATFKAYLNVGAIENLGQVYNADTKQYTTIHLNSDQLQVGQPIFVQPIAAKNVVAERDIHPSAAPRRAKANVTPFTRYEVALSSADGQVADRIIVRMDENKEAEEYTVGQDLAKMGVSTAVPQMWVNRYNTQLCVNTTSPTYNRADYPLALFAPAAGEYTIAITGDPTLVNNDAMLYLTYDGKAVWNLNYAPYNLTMEGGTNTHYGLRIVYAPQVTTDIEQTAEENNLTVRKMIVEDKVYIIRGNNVYSIDGQLVK